MSYLIEVKNKNGKRVISSTLDNLLGIEEWRDIKGYEGKYQISDTGMVRCMKNGNIMLPCTNEKGYERIDLYNSKGERKHHKIHRLVAEAFIPNPMNYPQVNHIDGDKKNNNVSNLEWCNNSMNMLHAYKIGLR